jgi:dTDP-glucose pyrophosphorylase
VTLVSLSAALLEISLRQLKACGVTEFCLIVSAKTRSSIESLLGFSHLGLPVVYAEQVQRFVVFAF